MIDKRPGLIVRPRSAGDVVAAVDLARRRGLPVAVRCGGHSVAGKGVCDDGLLVDLSLMKGVRVDPDRRTAHASGGVLWGDFDRETQAFGLATPGGRVTTTGIGGFTLGGGYGWLSPKYGLACDNLVSAEVVTADGRLLTASGTENEDLFWGLRGGGGNFGIVTSFEFRLHRVGPMVVGGMLMHPLEHASEVRRAYRDCVDAGPDELATAFALFPAPPEEFVPEHLRGKAVREKCRSSWRTRSTFRSPLARPARQPDSRDGVRARAGGRSCCGDGRGERGPASAVAGFVRR